MRPGAYKKKCNKAEAAQYSSQKPKTSYVNVTFKVLS